MFKYLFLLISITIFLNAEVIYSEKDIKKLPNGIAVELKTDKPLNGILKDFVGSQIRMEIPYKNGKEHGLAKAYYPNGYVKVQVNYKDGKRQSLEYFHENGQLEYKEIYNKNEKVEGEVTYYDKDANPFLVSYYFNGITTDEIQYKNGIAIKGWSLQEGKKVPYSQANLAALSNHVQYSPPPKEKTTKLQIDTNALLEKANDTYYRKNNAKDSLPLYQKAAQHGNVLAKMQLAKMYYYGLGVAKNQNKALELIKKSEKEFEQKVIDKDSFAQYLYAYFSESGIYFTKNSATAKKYYLKAAEQNNYMAQNNLGVIYGHEKNFTEAAKWYKRAATNGNSMAYFNLGVIYHNARGVKKDDEKAKKFYLKAIPYNIPNAQANYDKILEEEKKAYIAEQKEQEHKKEVEKNIQYIQNYRLPSVNCSRPSYPSGKLTNSKIKSYDKKSRKFQRCLNNTLDKIDRSFDTLVSKFSSGRLSDGQWKIRDSRYIPYLKDKKSDKQRLYNEIDDEFDWIKSELDDLDSDIQAENDRRNSSNSYSPSYNYNQPNYQYIPPKRSYVLPGMP